MEGNQLQQVKKLGKFPPSPLLFAPPSSSFNNLTVIGRFVERLKFAGSQGGQQLLDFCLQNEGVLHKFPNTASVEALAVLEVQLGKLLKKRHQALEELFAGEKPKHPVPPVAMEKLKRVFSLFASFQEDRLLPSSFLGKFVNHVLVERMSSLEFYCFQLKEKTESELCQFFVEMEGNERAMAHVQDPAKCISSCILLSFSNHRLMTKCRRLVTKVLQDKSSEDRFKHHHHHLMSKCVTAIQMFPDRDKGTVGASWLRFLHELDKELFLKQLKTLFLKMLECPHDIDTDGVVGILDCITQSMFIKSELDEACCEDLVDVLFSFLKSPEIERNSVVKIIGVVFSQFPNILINGMESVLLNDPAASTRLESIRVLRMASEKLSGLGDENPVGMELQKKIPENLSRAIKLDSSAKVRLLALETFCQLSKPEAQFPILLLKLRDKDQKVRFFAYERMVEVTTETPKVLGEKFAEMSKALEIGLTDKKKEIQQVAEQLMLQLLCEDQQKLSQKLQSLGVLHKTQTFGGFFEKHATKLLTRNLGAQVVAEEETEE